MKKNIWIYRDYNLSELPECTGHYHPEKWKQFEWERN